MVTPTDAFTFKFNATEKIFEYNWLRCDKIQVCPFNAPLFCVNIKGA